MAGKPQRQMNEAEGDPFDLATRYTALWAAWEKVRANQGSSGGDGVTIAEFGLDAANRVSRLSHALRNGSYRPREVRRVDIPKPGGGLRTLAIPSVADRIAQGSVAQAIGPALDRLMEPSSFAYRPGRSVADAVARIAALRREGYVHVVDGDIVRYFDNIPHEPLLELLDRHIQSPRLVDLIALWLETHSPAGLGISQGSPLSPLLANFYLDAIDEKIEGRGVRFVRYADDFVILCKEAAFAAGALERMRGLLAEAGLELHSQKTRLVSFDQGFRFLGHVMVKSMVWKEMHIDETPPEDLVAAAEKVLAAAVAGEHAPAAPGEGWRGLGAPRGRWSPRRRVLYVLEPGRKLEVAGTHFHVREDGQTLLDLPAERVDRIEIGPLAEISAGALDLASASSTELVRINGLGEATGYWTGSAPGRVRLQLAQAAAVLDEARRSALARAFVAGKIFNQRALLKRLDRRRKHPDAGAAFVRLARIWRKVGKLEMSPSVLLGHEGEAGALYWPLLAALLDLPWAFDGKRRRRIGHDPLNCVLDVLSSLLLRECRQSLMRAGLHVGYSFLHSCDDHESALAYDFAEEFRAPLVEAVAFGLFRRRALVQGSFLETPNGVRLSRDGWSAVVRAFEGQLAKSIRDSNGTEDFLWRGLLDEQAYRLADAIETGAAYSPYRMDF